MTRRRGETGEESGAACRVTLRSDTGVTAEIAGGREMQRLAMEWTYRLRQRRRWADEAARRDEQEAMCRQALQHLGLTETDLDRLGAARVIEVSVPWEREEVGWEARIFPWEFLLAGATRRARRGRSGPDGQFTIVRHLDCRPEAVPAAGRPASLLFVDNDFGPAGGSSKFHAAEALVKAALLPDQFTPEHRIPAAALRERVVQTAPEVLHLAGLDTHEGLRLGLLGTRAGEGAHADAAGAAVREGDPAAPAARRSRSPAPKPPGDGYLVPGAEGGAEVLEAAALAAIANAGQPHPRLVSCNFFYSAARVCPLLVAGGAGAALGFQDELEPELAEQFFSDFYTYLRHADGDLLTAFTHAHAALRRRPRSLVGTGYVLWSAHSLLDPRPPVSATAAAVPDSAGETDSLPVARRAGRRRTSPAADAAPREADTRPDGAPLPGVPVRSPDAGALLEAAVQREAQEVLKPPPTTEEAREFLTLALRPLRELNYALLHNGRALFEEFWVHKARLGRITGLRVEVELTADGRETVRFDERFTVEQPQDLKDQIHVPLLYGASRAPRENVRSVLRVRVTWEPPGGGAPLVLEQRTEPVTLLPLDLWRDDTTDRIWLPSFVQPRDPAVSEILAAGERVLAALADDGAAGFDGYQQVDPQQPGSEAVVDTQVRAIWAALALERNLRYTNPPPSYSRRSQRLRTPSDVLAEGRGTCIDLALLLCACMEYVGLYPVLFLIAGHAFPGYWRSEEAYNEFRTAGGSDPEPDSGGAQLPAVPSATPWYLEQACDPSAWRRVCRWVRDGRLAPIESTDLTRRGGFAAAIAAGVGNLRRESEFHGMLDVRLAREGDVTPLPLVTLR